MLKGLSCGHFFLFSLKNLRKVTCRTWLLESVVFGIYFCNTRPGPFLRAPVISSPIGLVNGGTSKHRCTSCSYRKCPQGGSTSSYPTLVLRQPETRRAPLLACDLQWNVPEQTLKGLCLTPSKLLPSPADSSQPWPQPLVRGLEDCTPFKGP